MINRKSSTPILSALAVSLLCGASMVARAQTSTTTSAYSPTATQTAATPSAKATAIAAKTPPSTHTISYTVVKGDSLTSIANKFNTTRKRLVALNNLAMPKVKPGQILLIPSTKTAKSTAAAAKAKAHHDYLAAQPVQDFDVPASTFASCPVPLPPDDADTTPDSTMEKAAPIAKLVSPAEAEAAEREAQREQGPEVTIITPTSPTPAPEAPDENDEAVQKTPVKHMAKTAPVPPIIYDDQVVQNVPTKHTKKALPAPAVTDDEMVQSAPGKQAAIVEPAPSGLAYPCPSYSARSSSSSSRLMARGLSSTTTSNPSMTAASDWGTRFLQTARDLGNKGIEYDDDWRPPGESRSWVMDCSNTSRYIYKVTAGLQLPRTASDQYYYLHLQGKAWDVPQRADGLVDTDGLLRHLKPGDLLFWENTYRPERQPPITHVMVYLGTNMQGQLLMAGSQGSRGGEHNRRNGGPDVYIFRPNQPCGGYSTWMGMVHHRGRFCAFGRPLEADPSKLSVAADN